MVTEVPLSAEMVDARMFYPVRGADAFWWTPLIDIDAQLPRLGRFIMDPTVLVLIFSALNVAVTLIIFCNFTY